MRVLQEFNLVTYMRKWLKSEGRLVQAHYTVQECWYIIIMPHMPTNHKPGLIESNIM